MNIRGRIILWCISFTGLLSMFISCERDDICAENVTPFLVIDFVDIEDPSSANDVVGLQIQYIGTNLIPGDTTQNVFSSATTTEQVSLLLPTFKNTASYKFIQNYSTFINEDGEVEEDLSNAEIDIVEFRYDTTEEYINRACGFRILYSNLRAEITPGDGDTITEGFINSREVINETIENEDEAHIRFLH